MVLVLTILAGTLLSGSSTVYAEDVVQEWKVTGSGLGFFRGSATDSNGNTYVTGGLTVMKYDSDGNLLWTTTYSPCGGPCEAGYAWAIAVAPSENYVYVAGQAGFSLNQDGYVAQIDSEGTFQWSRSTAGTGNTIDNMRGVVADASDNVYATGTNIGANPDWITAKYDVDGNLQ